MVMRVKSSVLILISVLFVISLVPQPADALVAWSINRNPSGFVGMTPGGSFPTNVTAATTDEETPTTFYARYLIGNSVFPSETVQIEPGGRVNVGITTFFTSDVMNTCVDGMMSFSLQFVIVQADGSEVVNYDLPQSLSCSVNPDGPSFAQAVVPVPIAECGPNNDIVPTADQPAGIILVSDTGWLDGERTVIFGADEGYFLEGPSEFTFTDAALPCMTGAPISPVQVSVCGPNNDELEFPMQPENVVLATDSGWVNGSRTVSYTAADGFVMDAKSQFTFTDENIACPVEPEVPTEPEPVDPVPTATPDPVESDPEVTTPDPTAVPADVADTATQSPATVTTLPSTGAGGSMSANAQVGLLAALSTCVLVLLVGSRRFRQR